MDTLDTLLVAQNGTGLHWSAILFWLVIVALAVAGVWYLNRVRTRKAREKREYLQDNPATDPHANPPKPRKP